MKTGTTGLGNLDHERLARECLEQLEKISTSNTDPFMKAEVEVHGLSPLDWLQQHPAGSRGYWSDRDTDFELAGVGAADVITGEDDVELKQLVGELRHRMEGQETSMRYFGGMRFSGGSRSAPEWERFKAYRYILPRFELTRHHGVSTFSCIMRRDESLDDIVSALDHLQQTEQRERLAWGSPCKRSDLPDRKDWQEMVQQVLDMVEDSSCQKVVLSRRCSFEFEETVDAAVLLARLKKVTNQRFHFCFQPGPGSSFVGASPERLFRRNDRSLMTEALAGTRRIQALDTPGSGGRAHLLSDPKERAEHDFVVQGICEALEPLMETLNWENTPGVLDLARTQHLLSRFNGQLKPSIGDADLLYHLHPTPAVGGTPRAVAVDTIEQLEPFDRGWFAGPVGWITRDEAQFAVGIRSALVESDKVHVYSGAGIVATSNPDAEWDELENKVSDFLVAMQTND